MDVFQVDFLHYADILIGVRLQNLRNILSGVKCDMEKIVGR